MTHEQSTEAAKPSEGPLHLLTLHFERVTAPASRKTTLHDNGTKTTATYVAAHLSRCSEVGSSVEELKGFFARSLGGKELTCRIPAALEWLSDPARVLAYQGEGERYGLTTLGLAATRAILPLDLAAGFAQLIRDLLALDPSDQLLAMWKPLDHLIVLELLFDRSPRLCKFCASLPEKLDAWMATAADRVSLLYRVWISGSPGTSRAGEVLGSLGIQSSSPAIANDEWAREKANLAALQAAVLYELGQGITIDELELRWELKGLSGTEERWWDDFSWLLSGVAEMLDLRCFYFHLREECDADPDRAKRVKSLLLRMRAQTFALREHLSCCSPLGPVLRDIRATRADAGESRSVGVRSIRRLEEAGIRSIEELAPVEINDLVQLGIRKDFAEQIRAYISEVGHRSPKI